MTTLEPLINQRGAKRRPSTLPGITSITVECMPLLTLALRILRFPKGRMRMSGQQVFTLIDARTGGRSPTSAKGSSSTSRPE